MIELHNMGPHSQGRQVLRKNIWVLFFFIWYIARYEVDTGNEYVFHWFWAPAVKLVRDINVKWNRVGRQSPMVLVVANCLLTAIVRAAPVRQRCLSAERKVCTWLAQSKYRRPMTCTVTAPWVGQATNLGLIPSEGEGYFCTHPSSVTGSIGHIPSSSQSGRGVNSATHAFN
jgi:hypothetical protein